MDVAAMSTQRTITLAILTIVVAVVSFSYGAAVRAPIGPVLPAAPTQPASGPETESSPPTSSGLLLEDAQITYENRRQLEHVIWALGRLDRLGGEMPPIDIHMHTSKDECDGNSGYYVPREQTIHVCGDRTILLHELGHAWEDANVDDATRSMLLELRGLDAWSHDDWDRNGSEHAAEIIAWGLVENDSWRPSTIPNNTYDELEAVFELLTGRRPLHATDTVYVEDVDRDWTVPTRTAG